MNISSPFATGFKARNDSLGPSNTVIAFGSHEWFAAAAKGSTHIPRGSNVGVHNVNELVKTLPC